MAEAVAVTSSSSSSSSGLMGLGLKLRQIRVKPIVAASASASQRVVADAVEHEMEPMTPAGRAFSESIFNCHILVVFGLMFPMDLESMKNALSNTLLKHKRFCSVVKKDKTGRLYWMYTSVNLVDHIIVPELTHDQVHSGNCVEDYVARLAESPPLDPARPLWEIHIINARLGEAMTNMVFRLHHSVGDGTSLLSLFLACTRRVDKPELLPTIPSQPRRTFNVQDRDMPVIQVKHRSLHIGPLWTLLFLIRRVFLVLWYTIVDICMLLATCLWKDDSQTPIKGFPGVEFHPKILAHATVCFEDLVMVKRAINGTINDVIFGMLSAGLSRYLQHRFAEDSLKENLKCGETENGKRRKGEYCSKIGNGLEKQHLKSLSQVRLLRASALMNTRRSPGLQDLYLMMDKGSNARWGNEMGYLLIPLFVGECSDPLEYVRLAKTRNDQKKMSLAARCTYVSGALVMMLFGAKAAAMFTYRCTSHATLSVSNMAGPLEQVQFANNPITHIIPTVHGQPQSLCVHFQSYMGKVTMASFGASDIIPDPHRLCEYVMCSLQEMKQQCTGK